MIDLKIKQNDINNVIGYMPEHAIMLKKIDTNMPEITRALSLFGKSQSQFMDNMLTVHHPTPLRNLRQILAEIQKSKLALQESILKNKKQEIEIRILERDLDSAKDELEKELLKIEIEEKKNQISSSQIYASGAIRKIANYIDQYNSILESIGTEDFNEIDFEQEEERYHIMTAFWQGVVAARCRNGIIDEGNQIYLNQLGINGGTAQAYVFKYFAEEEKLIKEGKEPGHEMFMSFLDNMANKFKGCSTRYARAKGMTGTYKPENSLIEGDTRLFGD